MKKLPLALILGLQNYNNNMRSVELICSIANYDINYTMIFKSNQTQTELFLK